MLIDTNIVIDLFKENDKLSDFLDEQSIIYVPSIVLGELYYGAFRSENPAKHIEKINSFINRCTPLAVDDTTAELYGILKSELKKKGKPIPENDIWIAASTKQHSLPLLTMDRHFENVSGIDVRFWK